MFSHRISYSKKVPKEYADNWRGQKYMIYTDIQLKEKIIQMIESFESEVVEFKEAKTNYSFNDIGKYFSALSNEANIRGFQEAWLVFLMTRNLQEQNSENKVGCRV